MTATLPLFPLNTVVFPGGRLPLRIFEQRYMDMVKQAIAERRPFGICAIREGSEVGAPAVPYDVGTRVEVTDWEMPQTGILHITTRALERFVVRSRQSDAKGLLVGEVDEITPEPHSRVPEDMRMVVDILRHIMEQVGMEAFPAPQQLDNAAWVGYRLAEVLTLKLSVRQNLLEMNDSVTRLRILHEFLKRQIA